ncbi:MAG: L-threonylcarbamoyladenylate synthase [Blautia sp.]|jgi:L-threonylcarbamoyladenylate synthase
MKAEIVKIQRDCLDAKEIARAGEILKAGGLVAFPTETVYGLGGNAMDPSASKKIYAAKGRPSDNPLIVHIAELEDLEKVAAEVSREARLLAETFWPGPLTMILPKAEAVPVETTGGLDSVAVRMPDHPTALALIRAGGGFVAAPSANTSGRPSPTTAAHVAEDLGNAIEMILDDGPVGIGIESTIVDLTEDVPTVLRPGYISLEDLKAVLGEVRMDRGLLITDEKIHPKAPGMKYRHYAPKAELTILEGSMELVVKRMNQLAEEAKSRGQKVGIICTEETRPRYSAGIIKCIGSRQQEETIARHLYEVLREFDQCQVEHIYSEAFDTPKMGQAIMNRLLKAAGHKIIKIEEEEQ